MKFIFRKSDLIIKIIAWIQIAGGIMGLWLIAYLMLHTDAINGGMLLIFTVGLSLFIFSIYCGNTLLHRDTIRKGIIISIINQALQFVQWCLFGCGFSYSSGLNLAIGLKGLSISANFNIISSTFQMTIYTADPVLFKVNILAIVVFAILLDIYHKPKEEPQPELISYAEAKVPE